MDPVTAGAFGGLVALLSAIGWAFYKAWPAVRKLNHFVDDVAGEPARPGVPARPGLVERMANVEDDMRVVKAEVKNSYHTNLREDLDGMAAEVRALHNRWATSTGKD